MTNIELDQFVLAFIWNLPERRFCCRTLRSRLVLSGLNFQVLHVECNRFTILVRVPFERLCVFSVGASPRP